MKILSFGNIPDWAGGLQNTGLANVIYQLAKNMSDCKEADVALAATDVHLPTIRDGNLTIYGWEKWSLLKYILANPAISIKWIVFLIGARIKYGYPLSVLHFFVKGMHLSKCIQMFKPDVVHFHGVWACIYDYLVPDGVEVIVTMHGLIGNDTNIPHNRELMKMEREICKSNRYSQVVFVAKQLIGQFDELYQGIVPKAISIPNAYDNKSFFYIEPKSHDKLTLVTIASISHRKGQQKVLKAIARAGIDCRYICIGAGSDEMVRMNDGLARQNGIDFEYAGKKNPAEIREYMAKADYMILPSSSEGFGLVFLESIACGVPVVLPKDLPIVKEENLIVPGVNSVLMEDGSEETIAETLKTLDRYAFDHELVAATISGYTWQSVAKRYIECL